MIWFRQMWNQRRHSAVRTDIDGARAWSYHLFYNNRLTAFNYLCAGEQAANEIMKLERDQEANTN